MRCSPNAALREACFEINAFIHLAVAPQEGAGRAKANCASLIRTMSVAVEEKSSHKPAQRPRYPVFVSGEPVRTDIPTCKVLKPEFPKQPRSFYTAQTHLSRLCCFLLSMDDCSKPARHTQNHLPTLACIC